MNEIKQQKIVLETLAAAVTAELSVQRVSGEMTDKRRAKRPRSVPGKAGAKLHLVVSAVTDEERAYFVDWVEKRNLDKQYLVLALTYWMRVKSRIWTCFLKHRKELYMVVCIHIALKWLGYDEVSKCDFVKDLRQISPVTAEDHQGMEFVVLSELEWDL